MLSADKFANSLDPDQARHFVGPYLGPKCLQRLSADDTSSQRVKICLNFVFRIVTFQSVICLSSSVYLTLFIRIDFPRHVATISMGHPIFCFKGSQDKISNLWYISVP